MQVACKACLLIHGLMLMESCFAITHHQDGPSIDLVVFTECSNGNYNAIDARELAPEGALSVRRPWYPGVVSTPCPRDDARWQLS